MDKRFFKILATREQLESVGISYELTGLLGELIKEYEATGYITLSVAHKPNSVYFVNDFDIPRQWLEEKIIDSIFCPNCKEPIGETCGCFRNKCLECGKPVGNITFSYCDECYNKTKFMTENYSKENKNKVPCLRINLDYTII